MNHRRTIAALLGALGMFLVLPCRPAAAQPLGPDAQTIRNVLTHWMADFNAARTDRICDLFAPGLRYDYRGFAERDYQKMCDGLHESLNDRDKHYSYALDIKDIMVAGDLAVARLVWTLTATSHSAAKPIVTQEYSMDALHRQADGTWKIVRFTAYEAP